MARIPIHDHSGFNEGGKLRPFSALVGGSTGGSGTGGIGAPSSQYAADTSLEAHTGDTADAHDASAVSFSPAAGIAATDVQAAIVEDAGDLAAHLADTTAAHAASAIAFTPNGSIAATDVQAAIQEVRDEATGGGSLTVEEVDGSPTDSAVTKIVFPNGTLGIVSHVATYTPTAGGGGISSGTSFPAQPAFGNNVPFLREDLGRIYFYDGTRWLSVHLYEWLSGDGVSRTASASPWGYALITDNIWAVDVGWTYQIGTTHTATHYWTGKISDINGGNATTLTSNQSTINTPVYPAATAIGAVITAPQYMLFSLTKVSSPGPILAGFRFRYRLIAT